MGVDHLRTAVSLREEVRSFARRLRTLENATPMNAAAIGRGGIEVYDGGVITIQNGGLLVHGWIDVDGEIRVAGTLRGTGELVWTGKVTASGQTDLTGPTKVTGAFTVDGLTKLLKTLTVEGAGKIQVGTAMTLDPSSGSGALLFNTGAKLEADGAGARLISGTGPRVYVFPTSVGIQYDPNFYLQANASGISAGLPTIARGLANNAVVGTVWSSPSGQLFRVVN